MGMMAAGTRAPIAMAEKLNPTNDDKCSRTVA